MLQLQNSPHACENCPVVSPAPEGSDINIEQSEAPRDSLAPEKPDSSVETLSSAESQQESSPVEEKIIIIIIIIIIDLFQFGL